MTYQASFLRCLARHHSHWMAWAFAGRHQLEGAARESLYEANVSYGLITWVAVKELEIKLPESRKKIIYYISILW